MAKQFTLDNSKSSCTDFDAVNLRPHTGADRSILLRPVGSPASHALLRDFTPLAHITDSQGTPRLVLVNGRTLVACPITHEPLTSLDPYRSALPLPADFRSFVSANSKSITIFTNSGTTIISLDEDGRPLHSSPATSYPSISIMAVEASPLSVNIPGRKLSSVYTDTDISAADTKALVADLSNAYLSLCATARSANLALQPALARYKLFAGDGSLLFTSEPVLLTSSSGSQCVDAVNLYSPDRQNIASYSITASTWKPSLWCDAADENTAALVARAEVYISPLFHPYNPGEDSQVTLTRATSASQPFARVSMPGRDNALSAAGGKTRLMRAICMMSSFERLAAIIHHPFHAEPYAPEAPIFSFSTPSDDIRAIDDALAAPLVPANAPDGSISASFSASASAVTAYASYDIISAAALNPGIFAAERAADPYSIAIRLTRSDGRASGLDSEASSGAFAILNPLIVCREKDAVRLQLKITSGGVSRYISCPLTPLPDGSGAVYISPAMLPLAIPESEAPELPQPVSFAESFPDSIAFAEASEPTKILTGATVPGGEIMALLPRTGSDSSWEFRRARFLIATRSSICSVAIDASRSKLAFRTLIDSGISRRDAICSLPSGSVLAVVGGRIIEILPSGRIRDFCSDTDYLAIAYNPVFNELWALRADRECDIFCISFGNRRYLRNDIAPETFLPFIGGLCARGASLMFPAYELPQPKGFEISRRLLPDAHKLRSPRMLGVNIKGADIKASFDVWDCGVDCLGRWPLMSIAIDGAVHAPLRFLPLGRPIRALDISVSGTASPDTAFHSFIITLN